MADSYFSHLLHIQCMHIYNACVVKGRGEKVAMRHLWQQFLSMENKRISHWSSANLILLSPNVICRGRVGGPPYIRHSANLSIIGVFSWLFSNVCWGPFAYRAVFSNLVPWQKALLYMVVWSSAHSKMPEMGQTKSSPSLNCAIMRWEVQCGSCEGESIKGVRCSCIGVWCVHDTRGSLGWEQVWEPLLLDRRYVIVVQLFYWCSVFLWFLHTFPVMNACCNESYIEMGLWTKIRLFGL